MTDLRGELRVGAHVLVQLGSELVTDVEQALLECVKNAYDADSPGCRISIRTGDTGALEETASAGTLIQFDEAAENVSILFEDANGHPLTRRPQPDELIRRRLTYRGRISIEDSGTGISFEDLSRSWLVISASLKRNDKEGPKRKTPRGRTPLGDKGLGRLGTMKLGDILLVESATSADAEVASAWFRWADCERARTVDEIPVNLGRASNQTRFKGTRVSVLGLRDLDEWRRKDRLTEITRSLAKLISPFEAAATFPVTVDLDGGEQSLALVTEAVLARSVADFRFEWEASEGKPVLVARARIRRRLLASNRTKELAERTARVFDSDGGEAFADYLRKGTRLKGYDNVKVDVDAPWFVEIEHRINGRDLLRKSPHAVQNPGPFDAAFYFFHFVGDEEEQVGAASGRRASLRLVRDLAGISILRDGFQVRNRGDWLSLSSGMTSGSTYNMRPENTLGYFALTGERNYRLTEKSDREGFVDNAAYRGFYQVALECRNFANGALLAVRRSLDEYDRKNLERRRDDEQPSPKGDLARVSSLATASLKAGQVASKLSEEVRLLGEPDGDSVERRDRVVALAEDVLRITTEETGSGEPPEVLVKRIERELIEGRERAAALIESAAAGLASRGLMHELRTHLAAIRHSVTAIERAGSGASGNAAHLTTIRRSCNAISQAAAQIDPLIPRAREKKETFDLLEFIASYFEQRAGVLGTSDIVAEVEGAPLKVRMSRSHLLQTLDNLTRNSVVWLGRQPKSRDRRIEVATTTKGFIFSDNGPGIDPLVEESLFDLFVTTRQQEEGGQGLGLFITSELLALDGCSIALLPERNKAKRRYKFVIDLTPVIQES